MAAGAVDVTSAFEPLIYLVPVALVWVAGLVVAAVRAPVHPKVSALAAAGLVVLLLTSSATTALQIELQLTEDYAFYSSTTYTAVQIAAVVARAAGLAAVLGSAYVGRLGTS